MLGECELAAPVSDRLGAPAGAIGLVVPASEWPLDTSVTDALRTAARSVSRELGATRWPPAGHLRPDARKRRKPRPA